MLSVEFKFRSGDYVRTALGEIGIVISATVEYGFHAYLVRTHQGRDWYPVKQLELTEDRPFPEMAPRLKESPP